MATARKARLRASDEVATRKAVRADLERRRSSRERPTINPATYTKVCSVKVNCDGTAMLAEGNFFRVQAMADGYASRCKKCWNVRGVENRPASQEKAPEAPRAAQSHRYHYPPGTTAHSHTREQERALEKDAAKGHRLLGYARVGPVLVPVIGATEPLFLDEEPRR